MEKVIQKSPDHKQVGKTTSVRAFVEENNENIVYVNFKCNNSAKKIFDDDLVINRIILSFYLSFLLQ